MARTDDSLVLPLLLHLRVDTVENIRPRLSVTESLSSLITTCHGCFLAILPVQDACNNPDELKVDGHQTERRLRLCVDAF